MVKLDYMVKPVIQLLIGPPRATAPAAGSGARHSRPVGTLPG
jgi:hypothetical protein